ncbi:MAG: hypothetical protein ACJZ4L_08865 [Candidatus Poriferisodalaceae bacterium]
MNEIPHVPKAVVKIDDGGRIRNGWLINRPMELGAPGGKRN